MKLSKNNVEKMLRVVQATRDVEINCEECYDKIEQFVDMELSGKSPEEAMPLVEEHLHRCSECREEYKVLLTALSEFKDT